MRLSEFKELKMKKEGRVNSKKPVMDGIQFGSGKEAMIYQEFKLDPEIKILDFHPQYQLTPGFKRYGKKYQAMKYTADFLIERAGKPVVVEVKSKGTAKMTDYQMRKKMFLLQNPTLRFWEIIFDREIRTEKIY